uniref:5'-3' DNA helicase ZGRF1-like isoform X2 n=1 Tax=Pristiophorus japonicus TaxID=55135 RepID=UPI00398E7E4D
MSCREFVVLYTNQKTKKAKKWHDGVLKTSSSGNKVTLYDDKGLCLDHIYVRFEEIQSGNDFESDRYLITVEEEKAFKNVDINYSGQKEATKLVTTNIMPANLTRCHLPVGLKRKHTGFQGPREVSKKLTTEESDATSAMTTSQQPNFSVPQFYATSPLFSTLCAKETLTSSALVSEDSSCTFTNDPTGEAMPSSSLPAAQARNQYKKLRHCEEINPLHSRDAGFTRGDYREGISQELHFTTPTSSPGVCSHTNLIHENKRSKAQILALLDTKTVSSSHVLETFELKSLQPLVGDGNICEADNVPGHQWVSCFDHNGGYLVEKVDPRLIQCCNTELSTYLTDHSLKVNLSKGLGGEGSSQNIQKIQQKCEEKEDLIIQAANEPTKPQEVYTTTTAGETLDNSICKAKECSIKMNNPTKGLLSTADYQQSEKSVAPVESDTMDTNNFAGINFDLLGEFNADEMGTNDLYETEMFSQTSLNISSSSSEHIEVPFLLKDMEIHQSNHTELEAQLPVTEEEDSDRILNGKGQTEIKFRAVPNTESLSENHSSVARQISTLELKESRTKADKYSCLPAQRGTILLLKSLSEHSTAIESLEKLNVQKRFKDAAINRGPEQPFNRPEEISGGMIFKNVDSKHCYIMGHDPNYSSIDCNADRARRMFAIEQSLPALRSSPTEYSCAPAEAAGFVEMSEEHFDNNWLEKMRVSDRPLGTLQAAEFRGHQVKGSASSDTVVRVPQEELEFEEHFDPFYQVPGSLTTDASFISSPLPRNSMLTALFQISDPPIDASSFYDKRTHFNFAKEDICVWDEDDQVPVEPILPSNIPGQLNSSGPCSDRELTQWDFHKVKSPMQQVPSGDAVVGNVLRCSRDDLHSNVGEFEFLVPNHQLGTSGHPFGNERSNSFGNNAESRIQSAFRLRTPLVTMPTTDKCIDQTLASSSFESLSGIIEPDQLIQCSAIYSMNSRQEDLRDYSENRVRPEYMNRNCDSSDNNADAYIRELAKPIDLKTTLQSRASKWLKYQITAPPKPLSQNSDGCGEEDHIFGRKGMFEMEAFEEGNGKALMIQENVNDALSVQLIKDKLINQQETVLEVNETCSLPNISSVHKGYNVPSKTNHVLNWKDSENISQSELCFPRADVAQGAKFLKRQVTIPATFFSPAHYRQVFTAVIIEHLNILLFELSQKLHKALLKVDISQYSSEKTGTTAKKQHFVPLCQHQQPAKLVMVKKEGPNKGRLFYTCDASKADQCKFFKWLDHMQPIDLKQKMEPQSKLVLSDAKSLGAFIRSQYISLYSECQLHVRKRSAFQRKKFYRGKLKELINKERDWESCCKTKLYLWLSRRESSSVYNKDDLWVVSKTLKFDPLDTFIACSVFYGPSSTSEVELLPLKGYSPSNWSSDMIVHALFVGNASTELTSLRNLQEHVNPATLPLMPYLLKIPCNDEAIVRSARGRFVSPALTMPVVLTGLLCKERAVALATEMIQKFHLNTDQAAAFRQVAIMMAKGESPQDLILPVTVIHGVYGAGKSYLLAVMVLFLVHLFEESEAAEGTRQAPWKLLISASTNVAVDRVLLGLLELGFDRFIRVGSIRKIAKPILPYSLHAGSDSEELRELQALLKDDLTLVEKMHVRRSIEQHKLGRNRAVLKEVRVVGTTCAACPFQCMNNLSFPLVLLDECSQITEPASLLPIARFGCEKLILVGDPKQLPPTIQGSESAHDAGLEQTLFDRMCLMGYNPIMLRTQYRCHPTISAITNELFYDGNLIDGISALNLNPLLDWLPTLCFYNVKGREQLETDGSCHNLGEATFTVKLIQSLMASGIKGSMIGVITLYKSQMHKLCGLLNYTAQCDLAEIKAVQVSTVDAFQGAEKEIIVLSCVRTRQVGFIDSEKRMNVALTRGKRHLLIVGSLTCLRNNRLWERVIHHCEARENGLKHAYQCEPELEKILKCYSDQKLAEKAQKGQKKLKSGSKSIIPEEDNKRRRTEYIAKDGNSMSGMLCEITAARLH